MLINVFIFCTKWRIRNRANIPLFWCKQVQRKCMYSSFQLISEQFVDSLMTPDLVQSGKGLRDYDYLEM